MAKGTNLNLSTPALVKGLAPGETFSRSERIEVASSHAKDLNGVLARLRNNMNQAVSKVRRTLDGSNFRVESGVCLTDDKTAHIATVAVTRMDDGSDDSDEVDI